MQKNNSNLQFKKVVSSMKKYLILLLFTLLFHATFSQFKLLKDINTEPNTKGSIPSQLIKLGDKVIFAAYKSTTGQELWITDGTENGTKLIKDIWPGTAKSSISNLTRVGDWVYFLADDGDNDEQLWKTDGTSFGTKMITSASYYGIDDLFNMNGSLYFNAYYEGNPSLYKTDPITDSITKVFPEKGYNYEVMNGQIFFDMWYGSDGSELWISDGTESGTRLLKDINPGYRHSSPFNITKVSEIVFFTADDRDHGEELWKSDGTEEGTVIVKDIRPGSYSSSIKHLVAAGDLLYFLANDGETGEELWVSDGTDAGTYRVKDVAPGSNSSKIDEIKKDGNEVYFTRSTGSLSGELWKSDGTDFGTYMIKSFNYMRPENLAVINNRLYFSATDDAGRDLWVSDGTADGTVIVKEKISPDEITEYNGLIIFQGWDYYHGPELWTSNGTQEGTFMVKDIYAGSTSSKVNNETPLYNASKKLNCRSLFPKAKDRA